MKLGFRIRLIVSNILWCNVTLAEWLFRIVTNEKVLSYRREKIYEKIFPKVKSESVKE